MKPLQSAEVFDPYLAGHVSALEPMNARSNPLLYNTSKLSLGGEAPLLGARVSGLSRDFSAATSAQLGGNAMSPLNVELGSMS